MKFSFFSKKHKASSYKLPPIFTEDTNDKPYLIVNCAYRTYDAKKGGTGGPGGVLHQTELMFKNVYKGIPMKYIYRENFDIPKELIKEIDSFVPGTKMVLEAICYIDSRSDIWEMKKDYNLFFICHDVGSAYAVYLRHHPYVVVWHQQGSLANEFIGFGDKLSEKELQLLTRTEHIALTNAMNMYFPSKGAMETYIRTADIDYTRIRFGSYPLYNTIPDKPKINESDLIKQYFKIDEREQYQLFVSVGDWTSNKGMDQIPALLNQYCKESNQKVWWIAVGNGTKSGIFEKMVNDSKTWNFKSTLIGKRINHDAILALFEYADYYIMLHRHAIFDLSTLEAMRASNGLILSELEGNIDFNKENNVIFVSNNDVSAAVKRLKSTNPKDFGKLNQKVFNDYFSQRKFFERYAGMIDEHLRYLGEFGDNVSRINSITMPAWKNKFSGKTAVICGSGPSLNGYSPLPDAYHIALNATVFNNNIKFDALFMQDVPINNIPFEQYDQYNCHKFYGKINVTKHKHLNIDFSKIKSTDHTIYELSKSVYDVRIDRVPYMDLDKKCFADANSVLFSAIQFAVYAGFNHIYLVGIDYSNTNYNGEKNKSVYAQKVIMNIESFKFQLYKFYPNIILEFLNTTNQQMLDCFKRIDLKTNNLIVTGIFTENYRNIVNIQRNSCKDTFIFDYRYITDEEWQSNKTSNDFAFFGGNTIKTQLVIDKIKEYWGRIIIVADADVIFLKSAQQQIMNELKDNDMLFLKERADPVNNGYEKTCLNINIGFVVIRCNERSLKYWELVQKDTKEKQGWDQEIANNILANDYDSLKWSMLSELFLNGNELSKDNIHKQMICTACGTIAKRKKLSKEQYLVKVLNMANCTDLKWFDGTDL